MATNNSVPICRCSNQWEGDRCEISSNCDSYCHNGGKCSISENLYFCDCPPEFEGPRCMTLKKIATDSSLNKKDEDAMNTITIVMAVIGLILVAIVVGLMYIFIKRNKNFTHERLQENDFNNPIYQDRDAEPFSLDSEKVYLNYLCLIEDILLYNTNIYILKFSAIK